MPELYPGAIWHPSPLRLASRPQTLGIVEHWTSGHEAGDVATLSGTSVCVQFYITHSGHVYQFLPLDSQAWHAFHTANTYCLGIEHEGNGEPWTAAQFAASAKLNAWLCKRYDIPVAHAHPRAGDLSTWHGLYGHRDLAGIDGNDHNDSVPDDPGWDKFLAAVKGHPDVPLTDGNTLRLQLQGHALMAGWGECRGPVTNVARDGLKRGNKCWIAWKGSSWHGPVDVTNVCRRLAHDFNL